MDTKRTGIAIVCQGGGSHAAYAAGALQTLLPQLDPLDLRLVGISGTSGGAICALLAWYGMLEGGPACAGAKLDGFWRANCAQLPGERLWNDSAIQLSAALPYEIMFSPYQMPLLLSQAMLTQWWPALAGFAAPYNIFSYANWGRGNFFQLDEMVKPFVNFELVAALCDFCAIDSDIARWHAADRQTQLLAGSDAAKRAKRGIEQKIRAALAQRSRIAQLMDDAGFTDAGLLRTALAQWPAPEADVTAGRAEDWITQVDAGIAAVLAYVPKLLLGAVNVGSGEFTAFSSENAADENGITLKAVLASAALPWLFKAVSIDTATADGRQEPKLYWDGLFSQNPPITNFIAGSSNERKPDQFWVLQINPLDSDVATLQHDIWDRRNELSGNLSLNQEIAFIAAINRRLDMASATAGPPPDASGDKHVQVHRIILDSDAVEREARKPLGAVSKFDRDPFLKDALVHNGQDQADNFLRVRGAIASACADLQQQAYAGVPKDSAEVLETLRRISPEAGQKTIQLMIDETSIPSTSANPAERHQALARWHTRGSIGANTPVIAKGETEFDFGGDGQFTIHARKIKMSIDELPEAQPPASVERRARTSVASRSKGNGGQPSA